MGVPLRVGIIGVGKISEQYLANLPTFPGLRLVAVADLNQERAQQVADEQGVRALTVDALIDDPEIDAVLNLTIPAAHVEIGTRALKAGKHVFAEKPLGLNPAEAAPMLDLADELGLRFASAPDTVLGTGVQTARLTLDSGAIGTPIAAQVHWAAPGHERWHPAPEFYYQPGGGPLLDMGPYYLTALVHFFGPVVRVTGLATRSDRPRTIETGPKAGTPIEVTIDTHITALLEHASGVATTVTVSFEVWRSRAPKFEVYGTEGTISVPDPNMFSDPVEVAVRDEDWRVVPDSAGVIDTGRGVGLADLAEAISEDRPHRASGRVALHVLEIMDAVLRSNEEKAVVTIASTAEKPDVMPLRTAGSIGA
ncbi:oxidoreductase [Rathayibacter sp. AY1B7]|uniref:Gfo/Idh/MocA family protein n=1 Tax=unclassified Rathayibacter TaxID=2609250 RepID=UPI000CE781B9|nr:MULTISPECIES: Gfo/Idh/MocA family oxidoreductase [unclassified Rathayibacter]PPF45848.1 oxidoreductase [Rathayibacter sp. AY1A1]PPG82352.1 oxidoreductase [Rathayibacter sp. AY1H2]PPG99399.1 oxidoreductase [Rathayibacter sp. AY1G9]PPH97006.1 oxidoreductase [Rathayibacter sp. AY1B7]